MADFNSKSQIYLIVRSLSVCDTDTLEHDVHRTTPYRSEAFPLKTVREMNGTTAGRARVMQVQSPLANISAHDIAISTLWRDGVGHLLRAGSRCLTPVLLSGSAVEPSKAGVRSWSSVCGADTSMANQLVHFRVRDDQCRRSLKEIELLQTALYDSLDVSLRKDLIVSVRGAQNNVIALHSVQGKCYNTCICPVTNHMNRYS
ncbi:Hypothetical_protein [Hexamita inflata]|uniref:Hypothetical_protein n=1 Tax=Hexamita inflata TaxID=28002 RepID=A0AA86NK17_9EUKA|nr:Hypothetical protein HINF_LOCUS8413 [Hexamita inflata]